MSLKEPAMHTSKSGFSIKHKLQVLDILYQNIKPSEILAIQLFNPESSPSVEYNRKPISTEEEINFFSAFKD